MKDLTKCLGLAISYFILSVLLITVGIITRGLTARVSLIDILLFVPFTLLIWMSGVWSGFALIIKAEEEGEMKK